MQRGSVLTRRGNTNEATDWDSYYTNITPTAKLTRRYTTAVLLGAMRRYAWPTAERPALSILEIGGANSCFLDSILAGVACRSYDVVDTNAYGLSLLERRIGADSVVRLHQQSVLGLSLNQRADVVFSVGLIEHFDEPRTREAILAHFDVVRPGGVVIITFPTPTLLYRITRGLAEALGIWKFPDERPLGPAEVLAVVRERGDVALVKTLWPLVLTQILIVAQERGANAPE